MPIYLPIIGDHCLSWLFFTHFSSADLFLSGEQHSAPSCCVCLDPNKCLSFSLAHPPMTKRSLHSPPRVYRAIGTKEFKVFSPGLLFLHRQLLLCTWLPWPNNCVHNQLIAGSMNHLFLQTRLLELCD